MVLPRIIIAITGNNLEPQLFPRNNLYPKQASENDDDNLYARGSFVIDEGIIENSMHLNRVLCDGQLEFGRCYSSQFSIDIDASKLPIDPSGKEITVYAIPDIEPIHGHIVKKPLFTGIIDSCKVDYYGVVKTITAYDKLYYYRNVDVTSWWLDFWNKRSIPADTWEVYGTATLYELLISLLDYAGVEVVFPDSMSFDFPNLFQEVVCTKEFFAISKYKFGDALQDILEINAVFPQMNERGKLELTLIGSNQSYDFDSMVVDVSHSTYENYIFNKITGIEIIQDKDSLAFVGNRDNVYTIKDNTLVSLQSQDFIEDTLFNMLIFVNDIQQFKPCSLKLICTYWEEVDFEGQVYDVKTPRLGDQIHITTNWGVFNAYVLSLDLSGPQLIECTIDCPANGEVLTN